MQPLDYGTKLSVTRAAEVQKSHSTSVLVCRLFPICLVKSTNVLTMPFPSLHQISSIHQPFNASTHQVYHPIARPVINEAPEFPSFRTLPPEVRIKIWKAALLPRIIKIFPKLDRQTTAYELVIESQPVHLLHVCHESRVEARKQYSQISFANVILFISWARDTLFLDLPHESLDIEDTIPCLGAIFQSVRVLAIRMRTHVFWGFPDFLREASHLEKLLFIDGSEREVMPDVLGFLYFLDLGSLGSVAGYHTDLSREYQYFQEEVCIKLVECCPNKNFEVRQWEMSFDVISWVRSLNLSGERYCLLFPIT